MKKDEQHNFQGLEKPENFRKLLTKEEEEEEEEVQRDSKVVKEYVEKQFVKVVSVVQMQIKVLLLQTVHVWSREPLDEL